MITRSKGSSSIARRAGSSRFSCPALESQTNSSPFRSVKASPKTITRCFGNQIGVSDRPRPSYNATNPPGQDTIRNDGLQLRIRNIIWKEEHWTETPSIIVTDEQVNVPNMIWHQNNRGGRRMLIQSFPQTNIVQYWSKRIQ